MNHLPVVTVATITIVSRLKDKGFSNILETFFPIITVLFFLLWKLFTKWISLSSKSDELNNLSIIKTVPKSQNKKIVLHYVCLLFIL